MSRHASEIPSIPKFDKHTVTPDLLASFMPARTACILMVKSFESNVTYLHRGGRITDRDRPDLAWFYYCLGTIARREDDQI